jgi:hypothetical protein
MFGKSRCDYVLDAFKTRAVLCAAPAFRGRQGSSQVLGERSRARGGDQQNGRNVTPMKRRCYLTCNKISVCKKGKLCLENYMNRLPIPLEHFKIFIIILNTLVHVLYHPKAFIS